MKYFIPTMVLACLLQLSSLTQTATAADPSPLQTKLQESAKANQFTLIVFHKGDLTTTTGLIQTANTAISADPTKITSTTANVTDAQEKALVDKLGISRAPMPMLVVMAPNSAVTGLFPRTVTQEQISAAIVPPVMMACMKELQDQKLVFVCMTDNDKTIVPTGVENLQKDPGFKDRISLVSMNIKDASEARFHQQMKLDPAQVQGPYAVVIAPPGVLVGHFNSQSTAEQIAAAIHKSGKCCDDANCKHNKQ